MRRNGVVKFEEFADGFQFQGPSTRRPNTFPLASSWYFISSHRRIPLLYHQTHQVRTILAAHLSPIDTLHLGVHSCSAFSSSYTSLFFCHLLKLASISINKMNIMENAVSPTDNHHLSTEERKQSPPAFLDLADSVTYFYILVRFPPAHMIHFRQRGWGVICLTCLQWV